LIVQELPAGRLAPQLFVWEKPAVAVMDEIASAAFPLLVTVTGSDWLVVPTIWLPNDKLFCENAIPGDDTTFVPLPFEGLPQP
jgi:hypothetical protein